MSREADEWAYDKERGLLDATGEEYKAKTGFRNAREAMAGKSKKVGQAHSMPNSGVPPRLPKGQDWIVLRTGMAIISREKCEKGVSKKAIGQMVPLFTIVATDREAAMAEITARWTDLFDSWEHTDDRLNKLALKSAEAFRKRRQAREKALSSLTVKAFEKRRKQYRKQEKRNGT